MQEKILTQERQGSLNILRLTKYAAKVTQILNEYALEMFPNKYQSDFGSKDFQCDGFANDNRFANNGFSTVNEYYRTSKTRVCVTVGMMTTGYDCADLLNIAKM